MPPPPPLDVLPEMVVFVIISVAVTELKLIAPPMVPLPLALLPENVHASMVTALLAPVTRKAPPDPATEPPPEFPANVHPVKLIVADVPVLAMPPPVAAAVLLLNELLVMFQVVLLDPLLSAPPTAVDIDVVVELPVNVAALMVTIE